MPTCRPTLASSTKKLLQTQVDAATFRKFHQLAQKACNTKAGYLRRLVTQHVQGVVDLEAIAELRKR